MLKLKNMNDVIMASENWKRFVILLNEAINNGYLVQIEIDIYTPKKFDFQLKTKLTEVKIEKDTKSPLKKMYITADNLNFMFGFENFDDQSYYCDHDRFYFGTTKAEMILTIIS